MTRKRFYPVPDLEGINPIEAIRVELYEAWGDMKVKRQIKWPLFIRIGDIRK